MNKKTGCLSMILIVLIVVIISLVTQMNTFDAEQEDKVRKMVTVLKESGINNQTVLQAMKRVPRHRFIGKDLEDQAYDNNPLSIGLSQTISQPYIVAFMTEQLELTAESKVLEIGTGSGYQAAVLAEICKEVYSVERIIELLNTARELLKDLGYKNVYTKIGDGYLGWSENAPFDCIMVTAAASSTPQALLDQLKIGGRMIIPLEDKSGNQTLVKITRVSQQEFEQKSLLAVRFVPMLKDVG